MPSHARPTISKPLKPEDDWTRVKDPREKKRIQNRVAQRTYRHRMKARLGELQARLEQHEGPQPSSRPAPSSSPSFETFPPQPHPQAQHQATTFPSPPPSDLHRALPRLDTANLIYHQNIKLEPQEFAATALPNAAGQQQLEQQLENGGAQQSRSHSLPPNYGLLSPPSHSDCSSAITPDAIACPGLNAHYTDLSALPLLDDLSAVPQVSGTHSLGPGSTGSPSIDSPQLPDQQLPPTTLADQTSISFFTAPIASIPVTNAAALIDPSQGFNPSPTCTDQSQLVEHPAAAAGAENDMSAWDDAGFQDEVLKMTESVIKAENATARHDLIAKVAPLVDCCDENRLYSNHTLFQMKQIIQEDVPNSWAFAQAMSTDAGAAWQTDRSNIALASVLLTTFAGRISNEKLICLVGGCL